MVHLRVIFANLYAIQFESFFVTKKCLQVQYSCYAVKPFFFCQFEDNCTSINYAVTIHLQHVFPTNDDGHLHTAATSVSAIHVPPFKQ